MEEFDILMFEPPENLSERQELVTQVLESTKALLPFELAKLGEHCENISIEFTTHSGAGLMVGAEYDPETDIVMVILGIAEVKQEGDDEYMRTRAFALHYDFDEIELLKDEIVALTISGNEPSFSTPGRDEAIKEAYYNATTRDIGGLIPALQSCLGKYNPA